MAEFLKTFGATENISAAVEPHEYLVPGRSLRCDVQDRNAAGVALHWLDALRERELQQQRVVRGPQVVHRRRRRVRKAVNIHLLDARERLGPGHGSSEVDIESRHRLTVGL